MTKNFDNLLKACLNEMQTAPAPGNKEAELLKTVAGLLSKPDFSKAMEDLVKKHSSAQPTNPQQSTQQNPQQPNNQQKPSGQPAQQQSNQQNVNTAK